MSHELKTSPPIARADCLSLTHGKQPRIHLGFVDALRAIAALYVVLSHTIGQLVPYQAELLRTYPRSGKAFHFLAVAFLRHGHLAVAVFIVISGFCLMLPLARHDKVEMEGIGSFIKRRAWRILPPYYAAILITLLLMVLVPRINDVVAGEWVYSIPAFEFPTLLSHLFLFHHFSDQWISKIDPPLWSIGVEWQIYFLMPLLFLPLLRKLGRIRMLLIAVMLGIVVTYAGVGWLPKDKQYVHFVALFAAGMVTAQIGLSPSSDCQRLRRSFPAAKWFLSLLAVVLVLLGLQTRKSWSGIPFIRFLEAISWSHVWVMDYLVTACFCALLLSLCQEPSSGHLRLFHRVLHWAPLVFVGHFSYSIYLIHLPALRLVCTFGECFSFTALSQYLVLFALGVPFAVFSGYLLYLAVERHFIRTLPVHSR